MHLAELELGDGACTRRERRVPDGVSQGLSIRLLVQLLGFLSHASAVRRSLPLCLGLCESHTLGVVTDRLDVDEATQIQLFRPDERHLCDLAV